MAPVLTAAATLAVQALLLSGPALAQDLSAACDSVQNGYQCYTNVSRLWGEYSPYFTLAGQDESILDDIPDLCSVNFVYLLSRHGARFPTASKGADYSKAITDLKKNVTIYEGQYAFLKNFTYNLSTDNLTVFGEQEMYNSGVKFYSRYEELAKKATPVVRADAAPRVSMSAVNWTQAYHNSREADPLASGQDAYPYPILLLSDATGYNNTLSTSTCNNFENGYESDTSNDAQADWTNTGWVANITARLEAGLPNFYPSEKQTLYLMDMCPFETVYSPEGTLSPFCNLFTENDWQNYNYYNTLGKWYGYGSGNALGPSQGAGWVNELLARLTNTPVTPGAAVNSTLDDSNATFPENHTIYADFSHDDQLTSIFTALGLYNSTVLSNTTVETPQQESGYSASWTVPFAARMYFEKMTCPGYSEDLVRAIINDRVVPLVNCGADVLGRCTLSKFVASQSFSRELGLWNQLC